MRLINPVIVFLFLTGFSSLAFGQREANKLLEKGNAFYNNKKYNDAEVEYRKAITKSTNQFKSKFNLGDALYKQGKFEDAQKVFSEASTLAGDKADKAKAFHNIGNSFVKQEKFKEAADAYKKALKSNPEDEETRYNLAYAQKMIPKQEEQKNQQNQDKDNKNQDQNQDQNQQQKQQQQNADNQQQQKPKPQQGQMSEEQAKQMLEALGKNEKDIQEKLKKIRMQGSKQKLEKDW